jgi:3-deoxy-D-manno-octulosonic-acid transferase
MGLMMETEVWPSILFFSKNRFPIYLINGRLSVKSSHNFSKFGNLSKTLFGLFSGVFAQTQSDANEYQKFDVKNCIVTGNLKFDVPLDQNQIDQGVQWKSFFKDRQIIAIASSRDGEEKLIIQAWKKLKLDSKPLLILVPRHLTRIEEIEKFLQQENISYIKKSSIKIIESFGQEILIGDTMGEMSMYLSMADYVIMGGSWMGTGSQNLIEPISLGKPVILGPSTFNFADISQMAVKAGVALQTSTGSNTQLENYLINIMQNFKDHPKDLSDLEVTCRNFATLHQGATLKTLNNLEI